MLGFVDVMLFVCLPSFSFIHENIFKTVIVVLFC